MRGWVVVVLVCFAQFMVVLDVSVVNVALPTMGADLGISANSLQWVVNSYTLVFAGFLLLGGRAADLYGRKRTFFAGLAIFTVASLVGGLSGSPHTLIAARALQGLGAAVVSPATLTILTTTFVEGPLRTRAIATWSAVGAAGGGAGSLVGGVLTDYLSWRWILLINVPLGIVTVVVAVRALCEGRDSAARKLDIAGAVTSVVSLVCLTYGLSQIHERGWWSVWTVLPVALGLLGLVVFCLSQARAGSAALMPLRTFRSRSVSGATLVHVLFGSVGFAVWYFLSLFMQNVLGYGALHAGLSFLPFTLTLIAVSKATPRLLARFGIRPPIMAGALVAAAGFAWQSRITPDSTFVAGVLLPGMVIMCGIGLAYGPTTLAATSGVDSAEAGLVSGILNASRTVGGALGLAVLATAASAVPADLSAGYGLAFQISAVIMVVAMLAVLVLPKHTRTEVVGEDVELGIGTENSSARGVGAQ